MTWRNSLQAHRERQERRARAWRAEGRRPAVEAEPVTGSADLLHCLAVVRALSGRGFPFCASIAL